MQVLGFSYSLADEQMGYLLAEAQVGCGGRTVRRAAGRAGGGAAARCAPPGRPELQPPGPSRLALHPSGRHRPQVEGLALEAVDHADLERVLTSPDFRQRCAPSLKWLQVGGPAGRRGAGAASQPASPAAFFELGGRGRPLAGADSSTRGAAAAV